MKAQLVNGPVARMTIDTVTEESAESINELNQVIGTWGRESRLPLQYESLKDGFQASRGTATARIVSGEFGGMLGPPDF